MLVSSNDTKRSQRQRRRKMKRSRSRSQEYDWNKTTVTQQDLRQRALKIKDQEVLAPSVLRLTRLWYGTWVSDNGVYEAPVESNSRAMPPAAHTVNLEKSLSITSITLRCSPNALQISCTSSSNLAIHYVIVLAAASGGGGTCTGVRTAWLPSSTAGASLAALGAPAAALACLLWSRDYLKAQSPPSTPADVRA
ncbi:hypothetical protein Tco_0776220 [Tanacetum coccineum]